MKQQNLENVYLINYLVIMGIDNQNKEITYESIFNNEIELEILDVFSNNQDNMIDHLKFFENWIFPDGLKIYNQNQQLIFEKDDLQMQKSLNPLKFTEDIDSYYKINHFVATDDKYNHRYGTTLYFYEKCYIKSNKNHFKRDDHSKTLPKISLSQIKRNPYFQDSRIDMIYIPKAICLLSKCPIFDQQAQFLEQIWTRILSNVKRNQTFIVKFQNDIQFNDYDGKSICQVTENSLLEFYFSTIFSLLTYHDSEQEFTVKSLFENEDLLNFRINNGLYFDLSNISITPLIKNISVRSLIDLIKYILLEKQIIVFSSKPEIISLFFENIFNLMSPMKWNCIYIPLMPINMWETLEAMMPYIIGINKKYKDFILDNVNLQEQIIVDLDKDFIFADKTNDLPIDTKQYLEQNLTQLFEDYKKELAQKKQQQQKLNQITLKIKQTFLNFFLLLVNNYLPYFINQEKYQYQKADEQFNFKSYLDSFEAFDKSFYEEFCQRTMMFPKFIEDSMIALQDKSNQINLISEFIKNLKQLIIYCQLDKLNLQNNQKITPYMIGLRTLISSQDQQIQDTLNNIKQINIIKSKEKLSQYFKILEEKQINFDQQQITRKFYSNYQSIYQLLQNDHELYFEKDLNLNNLNKKCSKLRRLKIQNIVNMSTVQLSKSSSQHQFQLVDSKFFKHFEMNTTPRSTSLCIQQKQSIGKKLYTDQKRKSQDINWLSPQ